MSDQGVSTCIVWIEISHEGSLVVMFELRFRTMESLMATSELSFQMRESLVALYELNFTQKSLLWCCVGCEIRWGCYLRCCFFLSGCQFLCKLQSCLKRVVFRYDAFCWNINVCSCVSWRKLVCNGWLNRSSCWVFFSLGMCFRDWLKNLSFLLRHCTGDNFCWGIFIIWIVSPSLACIPYVVNSFAVLLTKKLILV